MDRVHPQAACPPSDDRSLALFVDTCKTRRVRNAPRSGTSYHHFHEKDFSSDRRVALLAWAFVEFLLGPPFMVGIAVVVGLGLIYARRLYQRCPHCGRVVRRVVQGWLRCGFCGRQYRRRLRLR